MAKGGLAPGPPPIESKAVELRDTAERSHRSAAVIKLIEDGGFTLPSSMVAQIESAISTGAAGDKYAQATNGGQPLGQATNRGQPLGRLGFVQFSLVSAVFFFYPSGPYTVEQLNT